MPELPEVETVRRGLEPVLTGARLTRVRQNRPDLRFPFPDRFPERLEGAVVERIDRRAKYLLMPLSTGETWVSHLGMTGRFTLDGEQLGEFEEAAPVAGKHEHLSLCVVRGGTTTRVGFADARRFGFMGLIPTGEVDAHPWFAGLGPEPLGNSFSGAHLAEAFVAKKQTIKVSLLDQRTVAGLGNIYVCEALYRARVSPLVAAGKVSKPRLETLAAVVRDVLNEAILAGGSTLKDFANAEGGQGYFQHRFDVYGREGKPCLADDCSGVVRRTVQGGRSTFWCPSCQKR
ncbi:MAG: bifunctional DNA-formamidopyrimidine glycosylase/DNA-(apurinic or apyrimidinic site) lyase [Brevundimonas sp.]|uniref:bifunctional DNA-formamidopyrimidine glycosylase/DNA-(apurinic or apyrimidinic site) lyase n=1 Tax=Brevundimonas sp. TaxID=1871086 RepID=UPI002734D3F1|nr:bifunctional DNA-formamidopyrimidine glycosylase/DNA-(apurinic or apyrimidinic site) lyase [Brevundimonas sp.]MDP3370875.1 bifunctional DNA-formamidopyrimidine glycosylase/DNA-(apurinic or apyrimidinic site) lyase [Brevundimonas sp.]MDP3656196.1 bifunctional DNA-formamidopyrimidine glycosylase/DNA-(apurinic or apyrimidinic site) lyase [Brevundimonas sp.]MDZ4108452.1 bifunctional DNA-formamidopyrimidine glycosylase/DNA-(apurinic or apyrimidinic site) lyase [Brevundimonas sp.]